MTFRHKTRLPHLLMRSRSVPHDRTLPAIVSSSLAVPALATLLLTTSLTAQSTTNEHAPTATDRSHVVMPPTTILGTRGGGNPSGVGSSLVSSQQGGGTLRPGLIINGDFESYSGGPCDVNLPNASFNARMSSLTAFGTAEEIDVYANPPCYGLPAVSGARKISLHRQDLSYGGLSDAFSFTLSSALTAGNRYTVSFWAESENIFDNRLGHVQIGVSSIPNSFGTLVYTGVSTTFGTWELFTTTFVSPVNGSYLTVNQAEFSAWTHIDAFNLVPGVVGYEPGPDSNPPGVPGNEGGDDEDLPDDDSIYGTYLFSGEFHHTAVDMRIRGRGFDFIWERKYRSRSGPTTAQGKGWDFPYNIYLEDDGGDRILHDGNSRTDRYQLEASGCYGRDQFFREIVPHGDGTHTLWFSDGGRWEFLSLGDPIAPGRISAIVDRNGNTMSFGYDASGRLTTITDTLGRPIQIAYDTAGMISTVSDFTGRQVVFGYSAGGDLVSARSPVVTGTPNSNDYPAGKTTTYTYSTSFADENLNHNLLSITDPKGQTWLTNTYAATANPADLDYDRLVRQVWGNPGDIIDVVYVAQVPDASNNQATIKAIVNDRVGNVKEFFYEAGRRLVMARAFTGRANPDQPTTDAQNRPGPSLRPDDPLSFETRWSWNQDKLCTEVLHPGGSRRLQVYELELTPGAGRLVRGNLRQRTTVAGPLGGDQPQITEAFTYAPGPAGCTGGTNFLVTYSNGRGLVTTHTYDASGNRTRTTHPIGVEDWEYNAFGQMSAHVLPANGSGVRRRDTFSYYSSGAQNGYLQAEVVAAGGVGITTIYEHDARGNVTRTIDPRGNDSLTTYNQLDQAVQGHSRLVDGVRYATLTWYDANNNVVRSDIENRDSRGALQTNTHWSTITEYEILDRVTCKAEERAPVQLADSSLSCSSFPAGTAILSRCSYDENRNRRLVESPEAVNGNKPADAVATLYDERDLVFETIRCPDDPALRSATQTDYDLNGNVWVVRVGLDDPEEQASFFVHDGYGRLVSTTDPMGNVTTRHYDANGNLVSERVDGQLVDDLGTAGNVRLSERSLSHDAMDRLVQSDLAHFECESGFTIGDGTSRTTTEYAANSQVTRVTDDRGNATTTTYDSANRVSVRTDAKGNTLTYTYDANGNVVSEASGELSDLGSPPRVFTTTRVYDALDRVREERDNVQNLTLTRYDSRSNPVRGTDARGTEVRVDVDGVDRAIASVIDLDGDGADGTSGADPDIVIGVDHDDNSNITHRRDDGGNETAEELDARDQPKKSDFADCTEETREYDVHGNLVFERDANGTEIASTYDLLNRLRSKAIAPGANVSMDTTFERYEYDGLGRLVLAQDDDSLVTRGYDSLGNGIEESVNGLMTASAFDGAGNLLVCIYPSGRIVTRTYDGLNRVKTVSDNLVGALATYEYIGPGRVERRVLTANGTRCNYSYDGILPNPPGDFGVKQVVRTTHERISTGTILDDRSYKWDRTGNKIARKDDRAGAPRYWHHYIYDRAQRLTDTLVLDGVGNTLRTTNYQLDGVGNRRNVSGAGTYDPGSYTLVATCDRRPADLEMNQYTRAATGACAYDSNGNLSACSLPASGSGPIQPSSRRGYLYDYADRLVERRASSSPARDRYLYDALGRRIEKILDATGSQPQVTKFVHAGWQVIEERDQTFALEASYVWGGYIDEPLTMRRGTTNHFYHSDDLGNVMALSNSSGAIVERYEYDDYGRLLNPVSLAPISSTPSPLGNPYFFQGHRYDTETGFYDYRTRYLDPRSGRFVTRDTIGIWGDATNLGNGTAFVGNSPWSRVDPLGQGPLEPALTEIELWLLALKNPGMTLQAVKEGDIIGPSVSWAIRNTIVEKGFVIGDTGVELLERMEGHEIRMRPRFSNLYKDLPDETSDRLLHVGKFAATEVTATVAGQQIVKHGGKLCKVVRCKLGELKLVTLTAAETEEHLLYAALVQKGRTPEQAWDLVRKLRTVPDIRTGFAFDDEVVDAGSKVFRNTVVQAVTAEEERLFKIIMERGGTEDRALEWIRSMRLVPEGFDIRKRLPDLVPR